MHPYYKEFLAYLNSEDKRKCVSFVLSKLAEGLIDIVTLYNEVLTPAVNAAPLSIDDNRTIIWLEHVRTSIARTIIECCYPYVLAQRDAEVGPDSRGKMIIACPSDEYHDLGARMACDFFALCGYEVTFIGANTPETELVTAVNYLRPLYVGISVSNYYHLITAKKLIELLAHIRRKKGNGYRIIVGGSAFQCNPELYKEMGADMLLQTYEEIKTFCESESQ
jgi:methanogenic corrinoid protein MtbC1